MARNSKYNSTLQGGSSGAKKSTYAFNAEPLWIPAKSSTSRSSGNGGGTRGSSVKGYSSKTQKTKR